MEQFTFYELYADILQSMDDVSAGKLASCICAYEFEDKEPAGELSDKENFYWSNIADILKEVKEKYVDNNFSFTVKVAPAKLRWKAIFHHSAVPAARIESVIEKKGFSAAEFYKEFDYPEAIWKGVLKGKYLPEKNLIYQIALITGASLEDVNELLAACGYAFDFSDARDVVIRFLLDYRITNPEMVEAAFAEYKIAPLIA